MTVTDDLNRTLNQLDRILLDDQSILYHVKQLPRRGKEQRIKAARLEIPFRSLHCHLITLAAHADILTGTVELPDDIADQIVFHDLAEILCGDKPDFSPEHMHPKTDYTQKQAEQAILARLSPTLRTRYKTVLAVEEPDFKALDKIDPIIAIWRMQRQYTPETEQYIRVMADYYDNPKVVPIAPPKLKSFIAFLQNKQNARQFATQGYDVFEKYDGPLTKEQIKTMLERPIISTSS